MPRSAQSDLSMRSPLTHADWFSNGAIHMKIVIVKYTIFEKNLKVRRKANTDAFCTLQQEHQPLVVTLGTFGILKYPVNVSNGDNEKG